MAVIMIVSAAFVACGSGDTAVVAPQDSAAPAEVAADTTESTEKTGSEVAKVSEPVSESVGMESTAVVVAPSDTPAETSEAAIVDLTPVDDPATEMALQSETDTEPDSTLAIATEPEATDAESTETALLTSYSDYGFALKLDLGADVQTGGWTEPEASLTQGIIAFAYNGVNANLVWGPPQDRSVLTFLADTYNVLRASQPSVTFESISDGDITISDQQGVFGGFKAVDGSGTSLGGGLIGTWICGDNEIAFRMTLTGEDATVVQLRFDRLLENFACSSS